MWVALKRADCCLVAFGGSKNSQLITASALFSFFSGNLSVNLLAVCPFKYKLFFIKIFSSSLKTMLIVHKHCSEVCCHCDNFRCHKLIAKVQK